MNTQNIGEYVRQNAEQDFNPPGWLKNGHIQSTLASLGLRKRYVEHCAQDLMTAGGEAVLLLPEDVKLHAVISQRPTTAKNDLVILIHGWEGSADSMYLRAAAGFLFNQGFDVVRLHLRDHGPSHDLNRDLFHSCRLQEVIDAVKAIQQTLPNRRLFLGGFSLGANFSLRVAAKAENNQIRLHRVFAVCPVLDPEHTMDHLDNGFFGYNWYFLRKWRRSLRRKQALFPDHYSFGDIDKMSLSELTEHCICRYSEYPDLRTYLRGYALVGDVLATIKTPTRVLLAADDPIIPAKDVSRLARPEALDIRVTNHGGHCGYIAGLNQPSYADVEMSKFFTI
ncbi:MAG: alpha/beta fold hydrolase [Pseudomonadota bacterium]